MRLEFGRGLDPGALLAVTNWNNSGNLRIYFATNPSGLNASHIPFHLSCVPGSPVPEGRPENSPPFQFQRWVTGSPSANQPRQGRKIPPIREPSAPPCANFPQITALAMFD